MFAAGLADASYVATWKDMDRAVVEILAASGVRGDQLVQASDEWEDMRLLARDRSGETAADERLKQSRSSMMRRRADRENAGSHAERNAGEASPHCVRFRRQLSLGPSGRNWNVGRDTLQRRAGITRRSRPLTDPCAATADGCRGDPAAAESAP